MGDTIKPENRGKLSVNLFNKAGTIQDHDGAKVVLHTDAAGHAAGVVTDAKGHEQCRFDGDRNVVVSPEFARSIDAFMEDVKHQTAELNAGYYPPIGDMARVGMALTMGSEIEVRPGDIAAMCKPVKPRSR